jgi:DNA-binding transcriptional regulator LsrR (DeoR family)
MAVRRTLAEADGTSTMLDVATRFYVRWESQTRIARELGLDPSTVSRLLKRAREEGVVHVEIRPPRSESVELARVISRRFSVPRVVVAASSDDDSIIAGAAADLLDLHLRSGMRLGVSWGRTLAAVIRRLTPRTVENLSISQLAGGVDDPEPGIQGHELVAEVAGLYPGSRVTYLHAPAIVGSPAARDALLGDRSVQAALEAARHCDVALVGVGQIDGRATLVRGGHVTRDDLDRLVADGAVGNVNTRFFGADGGPIRHLDERTIAIEWPDLRRIPTVVAVAAGGDKAPAIQGALLTGCIDVLVTDRPTAERLLAGVAGGPVMQHLA